MSALLVTSAPIARWRPRRALTTALLGLALVAGPGVQTVGAQELADRVARAPDGTVRLSYATRPGVCGDGAGGVGFGEERHMMRRTYRGTVRDGWEPDDCVPGPARVALSVRDGQVTRVRVHVGRRWRPDSGGAVHDLGTVGARAAAEYLLSVAETGAAAGDDAVLGAALADSVVIWPQLLRLARDQRRPRSTRQQASFWLAEAAGDVAVRSARGVPAGAESDREVREQVVFALSQRPRAESVPALIRVTRANDDPLIRRRAVFWLGQLGDPRALDLFEELLRGR